MSASSTIYRGATIRFATTFYDITGAVTQPTAAAINIAYFEDGAEISTLVEMTPPVSPSVQWTAQWDSREVTAPGQVWWSVHTEPALPFAVEDGSFQLSANNANLPTF